MVRVEAGAKSKGENKESNKKLEGVYSSFNKLCFVENGVGNVIEEQEDKLS